MSRRTSNITILTIVLFLLGFVPLFQSHPRALAYTPVNYLLAQSVVFLFGISLPKSEQNRFFLSPSFICVSYININFLLGSMGFLNGLAAPFMLVRFKEWQHANLTTFYFNIVNLLIISSFFFSKKIRLPNLKYVLDIRNVGALSLAVAGIGLILLFSLVSLKIAFLGGQGSFSVIPKTLGAILLFVALFRTARLSVRLICYAAIVVLFSLTAFDNKREAVFLLLPILLLESTRSVFRITFTRLLALVTGLSGIVYLILVMSILRGYGSYPATTFWEATRYVPDYIKSDSFVPSFLNNIEVSYAYFHSNNSVEMILRNPGQLALGETIVKPLFILIPREVFPRKPDSIIDLYTSSFSEEMRNRGVSWPISLQSEMFWNFHFFGLIGAFILLLVLNSLYLTIVDFIRNDNIINHIPLLFIYQQMLVLFRGSGLDLFVIDIIMSIGIFFLTKLILRMIVSRRRATMQADH